MSFSNNNQSKYTFQWKIKNISLKNEGDLTSPIFTPENLDGTKWYLKYHTLLEKSKFAILLCRNGEDFGPNKISVDFKIDVHVKNGNGNIIALHGNGERDYYKFEKGETLLLPFDSVDSNVRERSSGDEDVLTVSCYMFTHGKHSISECVTIIGANELFFIWDIKLSGCTSDSSQRRRFSLSETSLYEMTITAVNDIFKIKIKDMNEINLSSKIVCGEISLLNKKKSKAISRIEYYSFNVADRFHEWEFQPFFTMERVSEYLCGDTFYLLCQFSASNNKEWTEVVSQQSNFWSSLATLSDDFDDLLKTMNNSDVELQTENGSLYAHRVILAARSPVFRAMFKSESQLNVVKVSGMDINTAKFFLKFLYTGSVKDLDYNIASKLLLIAEDYQVHTLKGVCSEFIMTALSRENVCDVMNLALAMNLPNLKRSALKYIKKHFVELQKLPMFLESVGKNSRVFTEVFIPLSLKQCSLKE